MHYFFTIMRSSWNLNFDLLSLKAFRDVGVRATVWQKEFQYWFPVAVNKIHFEASLDLIFESLALVNSTNLAKMTQSHGYNKQKEDLRKAGPDAARCQEDLKKITWQKVMSASRLVTFREWLFAKKFRAENNDGALQFLIEHGLIYPSSIEGSLLFSPQHVDPLTGHAGGSTPSSSSLAFSRIRKQHTGPSHRQHRDGRRYDYDSSDDEYHRGDMHDRLMDAMRKGDVYATLDSALPKSVRNLTGPEKLSRAATLKSDKLPLVCIMDVVELGMDKVALLMITRHEKQSCP